MRLTNSLFGTLLILSTGAAEALPIGFGKNQGPVSYSEIKSDHFYIYHDSRTAGEGAMMLNALEAARKPMEYWFKEQRSGPLPVVMSAISENASFANFIADSIELQTLGQGTRELAWHEYVHSTMYRKLDNILGPAGALIHLPWMPAWFLEGLAESLSVSVGSDVTAGIERYQALTDDWPSYPRLHSLYSKVGFSERGYATSGALVSYLLRKGDPNKLPELLDDFYTYSMPWWWPWAAVPFNGFLPMERSLENYVQLNGEQLYSAYKTDAKTFWSQGNETFLVGSKDKRRYFTSIYGMKSDGEKILHLNQNDGDLQETSLEFDAAGWAQGLKQEREIDKEFGSFSRITTASLQAGVRYKDQHDGDTSEIRINFTKGDRKDIFIKRNAVIIGMTASETEIYWSEFSQGDSRFCSSKLAPAAKVGCHLQLKTPGKIRMIGEKRIAGKLAEIWLSESTEKLAGTLTQLHVLNVEKHTLRQKVYETDAGVITVTFAGNDIWILSAERQGRILRKISIDNQCLGQIVLKDHIVNTFGLNDGSLAVGLYAGDNFNVKKLSTAELQVKTCAPIVPPSSPIQYAVQQKTPVDLQTAFANSDIWQTGPKGTSKADLSALAGEKPLDQEIQADSGSESASSPAKWRPRPLFLFPWIGADDALGSQIGVVSVPLMDHMQNETVRATFLYGAASNFPYQEVSLTTTRFLPTMTLAGFRQQTYNGRFLKRSTDEIVSGYMDEKGARLESDTDFDALGGKASFGAGIKYAHLKPYIGPYTVRKGFLAEPAANLSLVNSFGRFSWSNSISGRVAPEAMNRNFDYNQVGAATTIGLSTGFLASKFSLGLEGSRTRGKKRRELQEVYRPLKTYIPGSGGGFNQNSFPIIGGDTGLFSPGFGDTQGRAKANWTFPLISDFDRLLWILYLERLDFTAFYNYGGAWNGMEPARGWDRLTRAHGYTIDLQLENKGVRFNLGIGTGQVMGKDPEVYLTTGFDALF